MRSPFENHGDDRPSRFDGLWHPVEQTETRRKGMFRKQKAFNAEVLNTLAALTEAIEELRGSIDDLPTVIDHQDLEQRVSELELDGEADLDEVKDDVRGVQSFTEDLEYKFDDLVNEVEGLQETVGKLAEKATKEKYAQPSRAEDEAARAQL